MPDNIFVQTQSVEKQADSTKSSSSQKSEKKDGSSFFDSIMKDVEKNATKETSKADKKVGQKTEGKETKATKAEDSKTQKIEKNPVNKMINSLVDIVVEQKNTKKDTQAESELDLNSIKKDEIKKTDKAIKDGLLKEIGKKDTKVEVELDLNSVKKDENKKTDKAIKDTKVENKIEQKNSNNKIDNIIKSTKTIQTNTKQIKKDLETTVNSDEELKQNIKAKLTEVSKAVVTIEKTVDAAIEDISKNLQDSSQIQLEQNKTKIKNKTKIISQSVENIDQKVSKLIDNNSISDSKKVTIKTQTTTNTQIKKSIQNDLDIIDEETVDIKMIISTTGDDIIKNTKTTKKVLTTTKAIQIDEKAPVMANMFLNKQKIEKEKVSLEQINKAKTNITQNKSTQAVKQSGEILELNVKNIKVEHKKEKGYKSKISQVTKETNSAIADLSKNHSFNKMLLDNKLEQLQTNKVLDVQKQISISNLKEATIQSDISKETSVKVQDKIPEIQITVPQSVTETIQNKIIGAQQKVGSFMSDVARSMYLNYKPPVTAFKMSLNPANLGNISVVIKSNKTTKAVDVSMNMNNSNTLDAFVDNRSALQNALQKQLGDGSSVSLNFGMQDGNSDQTFNQAYKDSQEQQTGKNTQNDTSVENEEEIQTEAEHSKEHY
jgi:hypothetical protein